MSEEQYKRVKATVVSNLMNQSSQANPDTVFKSVHDGLAKKGVLRITDGDTVVETETDGESEDFQIEELSEAPDPSTVSIPTKEEVELFRAMEAKQQAAKEEGKRTSLFQAGGPATQSLSKVASVGWSSVKRSPEEEEDSDLQDYLANATKKSEVYLTTIFFFGYCEKQ